MFIIFGISMTGGDTRDFTINTWRNLSNMNENNLNTKKEEEKPNF